MNIDFLQAGGVFKSKKNTNADVVLSVGESIEIGDSVVVEMLREGKITIKILIPMLIEKIGVYDSKEVEKIRRKVMHYFNG